MRTDLFRSDNSLLMHKILFVAINARYSHTNPAILYLRRICREKAITSQVEFTISQQPYEILKELHKHNCEIMAFSVYIWNSKQVKEILCDIKKVLPDVRILLGGPEVSYNSEWWLENFESIDYIVSGGGEQALSDLLESNFQFSAKLINVPNLPFNEIPFPYEEEDPRAFRNRILYYESSRGCPYRCTYCLSSRSDTPLELRSFDLVKEELDFFFRHKVPLVKFVDRTFNADREHARRIWSYLIERKAETRFHFEINPLLITEADIEILAKAGADLFQFEIGVQSTNSETLKEICRAGEWGSIRDRIKRLIERTEIPIHLDLIFGLPYETYISARQSFNDIYRMQPDHFQPGMLKVLPGTVMFVKAEEYEMLFQEEAPYRILSNRWISFSELTRLGNIEHLVNNLYNSGKFRETIKYFVSLYPEPFDFYESLEKYWAKGDLSFWQKDWIKTASLILDFVKKSQKQADHKFLIDCLRWDLCAHSGLQYYPPLLMSDVMGYLLKGWKKYLKIHSDVICREHGIEKGFLHRILPFRAESEKFKKMYQLEDEDSLIFIDKSGKFPEPVKIDLRGSEG